jgi:hypothetical protein
MVIVSLVLLILGLVIGGFLTSCYNSGCGQVSLKTKSHYFEP